MRVPRRCTLLAVTVAIGVLLGALAYGWRRDNLDEHSHLDRPPRIKPDYAGAVIPPNIAPLNFTILERAGRYQVRIHGRHGAAVTVASSNGHVVIPPGPWKALLADNVGGEVRFDVFAYDSDEGWRQYETIINKVATEKIDPILVYRFIRPIQSFWHHTAIYQRKIETYERSLVFDGDALNGACVNCHSFCNNSPEKMTIGTRSKDYGSSTLIADDGQVSKIGAKWGFTAWHPSGKLAAYSINKVRQFFHTTGVENRDVVDLDSAIMYYEVASRETKTAPALSRRDRLESYPTWSPDGKYLYYSSAPILWEDRHAIPPKDFDKVRYDLARISYDLEADTWGEPEVVLAAAETGLSILMPRISPDARFLVFVMCDYGCFPVFRTSSDLYIMDLRTRRHSKLEINSEYAESWHSFSANSRWLAFSSKKRGGLFTRTYFSYIDANGVAHKPFILPQEDPTYYDSLLFTYSVPELITGPVTIDPKTLVATSRSKKHIPVTLPIVTGPTPISSSASERE